MLIWKMYILIWVLSITLLSSISLLLRQPTIDWLERNGLMKDGKLFTQRW